MASFELDLREFETMLAKLADPEPIAKKMISEASPVAKDALVSNSPEETGEMKKSIRMSPIMRRNGGLFRVIRPTGVNSRGWRNMDVMAWKNYGTRNMPPEYFIEGAAFKCKDEVLDIMEETFYREVGAD